MVFIRILVSGMTKRIVLEEISRKTFLLMLGVMLVEGTLALRQVTSIYRNIQLHHNRAPGLDITIAHYHVR